VKISRPISNRRTSLVPAPIIGRWERRRRAARGALALLPVVHGLDQHADKGSELRLAELGARTHATRVSGRIPPRFRVVGSRLPRKLLFVRRIHSHPVDAPLERALPPRLIATTRPSAFSLALRAEIIR
jgi:hypothetical protein